MLTYGGPGGTTIDLSENLADITDDANGPSDAHGNLQAIIFRANPGDNQQFGTAVEPVNSDGIPTFGGGALQEGDRLFFYDLPGNIRITVSIYLNQAGGGATDLFVIDENGNFPVGVADPNADEFYLDANWVVTDEIVNAQGFVGPTCDAATTTQNPQTGECDCNAANPVRVDATMCMPQNPTCDPATTTGTLTGGTCTCLDTHENPTRTGDIISCELKAVAPPTPPPGGGGTQTQKSDNGFPVVGGVVAAVLIFGLSQAGTAGEFAFVPDFNYAITESGYSAKAGGRFDFRKDKWHLYYSGGQTNRDGDFGEFRYVSGGKYTADFWKATFSESISGETADYNFALSANFGGEIWNVSPTYRIHSRFDENDSEIKSETRNSLNLESELIYNRWTIKPSAGFSWQNENDFGDNARFRLNAVHRF